MSLSKTDRESHRYLIGFSENEEHLVYLNDLTLVEQHRIVELLTNESARSSIQCAIVNTMMEIRHIPYAELYLIDSTLSEREIEIRFNTNFKTTVEEIRKHGEQLYAYKETEQC